MAVNFKVPTDRRPLTTIPHIQTDMIDARLLKSCRLGLCPTWFITTRLVSASEIYFEVY